MRTCDRMNIEKMLHFGTRINLHGLCTNNIIQAKISPISSTSVWSCICLTAICESYSFLISASNVDKLLPCLADTGIIKSFWTRSLSSFRFSYKQLQHISIHSMEEKKWKLSLRVDESRAIVDNSSCNNFDKKITDFCHTVTHILPHLISSSPMKKDNFQNFTKCNFLKTVHNCNIYSIAPRRGLTKPTLCPNFS